MIKNIQIPSFQVGTRLRLNLGLDSHNFFNFGVTGFLPLVIRVRLCIPSSVLGGFRMILVGRHPLQSFPTSGARETYAKLGMLAILHVLRYILMGYELKICCS
jgi:hypothetical protein